MPTCVFVAIIMNYKYGPSRDYLLKIPATGPMHGNTVPSPVLLEGLLLCLLAYCICTCQLFKVSDIAELFFFHFASKAPEGRPVMPAAILLSGLPGLSFDSPFL